VADAALATTDGSTATRGRPWVRRPKLRESRYPELPNLRDFAMSVDRDLLEISGNLQRKYGEAWASEAGWRTMIAQDVRCPQCGISHPAGHMPGPSTIPKAIRRLAKHGLVLYRSLRKGDVMPDGSVCRKGTMLVYVPQGRHEKRALRSLAEHRAERDPYRVVPRGAKALKDTKKAIAKVFELPRAMTEDDRARKRAEDTRRARELAAQWDQEERGKPPPD